MFSKRTNSLEEEEDDGLNDVETNGENVVPAAEENENALDIIYNTDTQ